MQAPVNTIVNTIYEDFLKTKSVPGVIDLQVQELNNTEQASKIAEMLKSDSCPEKMHLDLAHNLQFGYKKLKIIIDALKVSKCRRLYFNLSSTADNQTLAYLGNEINSLKITHLTLKIYTFNNSNQLNDLETIGAEGIVKIINSGKCNRIELPNINTYPEIVDKTLSLGKYPQNFIIIFSDPSEKLFANSMLALGSGTCKKGLTLSFQAKPLEYDELIMLAYVLVSGSCPEDLYLDIARSNPFNKPRENHYKPIADALRSGKCPKGFHINLKDCSIDSSSLEYIFLALGYGKCPEGFKINLENNDIKSSMIKFLAEKLKSGNCPKNFSIDLSRNNIDIEGIKSIAEALKSGKCPKNFSIDLSRNNIDIEGIKSIAEALKSGNCPEGLNIILSGNELSDDAIKILADALSFGRCPRNLTLNLSRNNLTSQGVQHLSEALKSRKCPPGLEINLKNMYFDDDIISKLAESIPFGPSNLHLQIEHLNKDKHPYSNIKLLADAIAPNISPFGLRITIKDSSIENKILANNKFHNDIQRALKTTLFCMRILYLRSMNELSKNPNAYLSSIGYFKEILVINLPKETPENIKDKFHQIIRENYDNYKKILLQTYEDYNSGKSTEITTNKLVPPNEPKTKKQQSPNTTKRQVVDNDNSKPDSLEDAAKLKIIKELCNNYLAYLSNLPENIADNKPIQKKITTLNLLLVSNSIDMFKNFFYTPDIQGILKKNRDPLLKLIVKTIISILTLPFSAPYLINKGIERKSFNFFKPRSEILSENINKILDCPSENKRSKN